MVERVMSMLDRGNMATCIVLLSMLLLAPFTYASQPKQPFSGSSLTELEQRLEELDTELQQLAHYSLRTGIGSVGYRSDEHEDPNSTEWIQIELGQAYPLDEIVLVPSIWRDSEAGFRADGFPTAFNILAGDGYSTNVLASFNANDQLLPRIAPLILPCTATASWVRVEATSLSPRAFDGKYNLELAEVMVFSGQNNVALRKPVNISSKGHAEGGARKREFLVDGFVPYLMDAAQGKQSIAAVGAVDRGTKPSLTIDLGAEHHINRIHLHSVDLSDTIPQSTPTDFGLPPKLLIVGATIADFSDARPLATYEINSVFDAAPIIMFSFPKTVCRYVRLTALAPYEYTLDTKPGSRIGFAEIEVFSDTENTGNIAIGKPVIANFEMDNTARAFSSLTDGRNLYGNILPIRQWMNELARRHELEAERPLIAKELNHRYARQKANLRIMSWLAALLVAGIAFAILIERMIHMKQLAGVKKRFAADLHDELGANLHTIGLLSDMADEARNDPEDLTTFLQRIRNVTERTGSAVRHIANMQEAKILFTGVKSDMQRAAERIVANLEHEIHIEGEEHLQNLKPRVQSDLFLFYKECLVNACRHSGATQLATRLVADGRTVRLTILDNGRGIEGTAKGGIPSSLKRRAKLLGARIHVEHPENGGTRINLTLKPRRFWLF